MYPRLLFRFTPLAVLLAAIACEPADIRPASEAEEPLPGDAFPRAVRELVFVGELEGEPLSIWFNFVSEDRGDALRRTARGWIAHGSSWDRFLSETSTGGVPRAIWRIVPLGDLRVRVGEPAEIEELIHGHGADAFRVSIGDLRSGWQRMDPSRFRVMDGTLRIGDERISGRVIEAQHRRAPSHDQSEPPLRIDWTYLTDFAEGDLILTSPSGGAPEGGGWIRDSGMGQRGQTLDQIAIRWIEAQAVEQARRDIPVRWSYTAPGLGSEVEIEPAGRDITIGVERRGRRITNVRYMVSGEVEGRRWTGVARYERE